MLNWIAGAHCRHLILFTRSVDICKETSAQLSAHCSSVISARDTKLPLLGMSSFSHASSPCSYCLVFLQISPKWRRLWVQFPSLCTFIPVKNLPPISFARFTPSPQMKSCAAISTVGCNVFHPGFPYHHSTIIPQRRIWNQFTSGWKTTHIPFLQIQCEMHVCLTQSL